MKKIGIFALGALLSMALSGSLQAVTVKIPCESWEQYGENEGKKWEKIDEERGNN